MAKLAGSTRTCCAVDNGWRGRIEEDGAKACAQKLGTFLNPEVEISRERRRKTK